MPIVALRHIPAIAMHTALIALSSGCLHESQSTAPDKLKAGLLIVNEHRGPIDPKILKGPSHLTPYRVEGGIQE